jgi:hypothetical protein
MSHYRLRKFARKLCKRNCCSKIQIIFTNKPFERINNLNKHTGFYQPKFLTLKLEFNPENEALRIVTLRARGIITQ